MIAGRKRIALSIAAFALWAGAGYAQAQEAHSTCPDLEDFRRLGHGGEACDEIVAACGGTPAEDAASLQAAFSAYALASGDQKRTVCLLPITYEGAFEIRGAKHMRILGAVDGRTRLSLPPLPANTSSERLDATLSVIASDDVTIENVTLENTSQYPNAVEHKVARALAVQSGDPRRLGWTVRSSTNIRLVGPRIRVAGKQALHVDGQSDLSIEKSAFGSRVECFYMCIDARNASTVHARDIHFVFHHRQLADDPHPGMWMDSSSLVLNSCTFEFITGFGLLTTVGTGSRVEINGGTLIGEEEMEAWLPTHPNWQNLSAYITGDFGDIPPFACEPWTNPRCSDRRQRGAGGVGTELFVRDNASQPFRSIPLPPTAGDFLIALNVAPQDGAVRRMKLDPATKTLSADAIISWSQLPPGTWAGWVDANDRTLSGDFRGEGHSSLLFFNTNQSPSEGAILIQDIDWATGGLINRHWINWSEVPPSFYAGWLDANDRIVAGDFLNHGRDQLLFLDADSGQIRIQELNAASGRFEDVLAQPLAGAFGGWVDPPDRVLAGDFLWTGRTQLLFLNADPLRRDGAIRVQEFDTQQGDFVNRRVWSWMEVGAGTYNGWIDPQDRIFAADPLGHGRSQLVFINTDPLRAGGGLRVQELLAGQFEHQVWLDWSELGPTNFSGWLDDNDRMLPLSPGG